MVIFKLVFKADQDIESLILLLFKNSKHTCFTKSEFKQLNGMGGSSEVTIFPSSCNSKTICPYKIQRRYTLKLSFVGCKCIKINILYDKPWAVNVCQLHLHVVALELLHCYLYRWHTDYTSHPSISTPEGYFQYDGVHACECYMNFSGERGDMLPHNSLP